MTNHITAKLTYQNQDQRHKYHHLTTTLHLTLKTTTAQVVKTSVTNNSLSKDYLHPDDHAKQITDTPGFRAHCYICPCSSKHSDRVARSGCRFLATVHKHFGHTYVYNTHVQDWPSYAFLWHLHVFWLISDKGFLVYTFFFPREEFDFQRK